MQFYQKFRESQRKKNSKHVQGNDPVLKRGKNPNFLVAANHRVNKSFALAQSRSYTFPQLSQETIIPVSDSPCLISPQKGHSTFPEGLYFAKTLPAASKALWTSDRKIDTPAIFMKFLSPESASTPCSGRFFLSYTAQVELFENHRIVLSGRICGENAVLFKSATDHFMSQICLPGPKVFILPAPGFEEREKLDCRRENDCHAKE